VEALSLAAPVALKRAVGIRKPAALKRAFGIRIKT